METYFNLQRAEGYSDLCNGIKYVLKHCNKEGVKKCTLKSFFYIWDGGRTEILITEMSPKKFVRRPLAFSQHRFIQFLSLTD